MEGGDLVGQLPAAMPKTITATDQLLRSARSPEARHRALDLLLALATVECNASAGGPALVLPGLLRDLVIANTRLEGRNWLEVNAEETASFTRLQNSFHARHCQNSITCSHACYPIGLACPRRDHSLALSSLTAGRPQPPTVVLHSMSRPRQIV